MSCGVGRRRSSDPVLLWHRLVAMAPIRPLAWETPYAVEAALEMAKRPKKEKNRKKKKYIETDHVGNGVRRRVSVGCVPISALT